MNYLKFLILITAIVFPLYLTASDSPENSYKHAEPSSHKVETVKIREKTFPDILFFSATAAKENIVKLTPKVTGYIDEITVKTGDHFKKGDLLVDIRSEELKAKREHAEYAVKEAQAGIEQVKSNIKMAKTKKEKAEAQLELAEKTFKRYKNLLEKESVSQQEYDKVKAEYKSAKSMFEIASENINLAKKKLKTLQSKLNQAKSMLKEANTYLSYTKLYAPFNGIVLKKLIDSGNLASPRTPLLKIGSDKNVIYAEVSGSLYHRIKTGDELTVHNDSSDKSFKSIVLEKEGHIDPASRKFKIKIKGTENITSGSYLKVGIQDGTNKGIFIDKNAVKQTGQLETAFIAKNGKAHMRVLKLGKSYGNYIEVLSGLEIGEKLVAENVKGIKSGDILEEK